MFFTWNFNHPADITHDTDPQNGSAGVKIRAQHNTLFYTYTHTHTHTYTAYERIRRIHNKFRVTRYYLHYNIGYIYVYILYRSAAKAYR